MSNNCDTNQTKIENLDKRVSKLENKQDKLEDLINKIDKTLQVSLEQVKNIAEDLKTTSINFKEAIMRSNTANSKETEVLKEKCTELERKYEKLDAKVEQETVVKDAKKYRELVKQVIAWIVAAILGIVALYFGLK